MAAARGPAVGRTPRAPSRYADFESFGAQAFAERARRELLATGEHVHPHRPEARDALTAQEALIAKLARDGHTNPEIGSQLFLSARTVEYHLGKVFTKLNIGSRRELGAALLTDQEQRCRCSRGNVLRRLVFFAVKVLTF